MERVVRFVEKTEARDKLTKVLQYGGRFLKASVTDDALVTKFNGLYIYTRDARKVFRLLKSLNEYQSIMVTLNSKMPDIDKILTILSRAGFFIYWILDNLVILNAMKII